MTGQQQIILSILYTLCEERRGSVVCYQYFRNKMGNQESPPQSALGLGPFTEYTEYRNDLACTSLMTPQNMLLPTIVTSTAIYSSTFTGTFHPS